MIWPENLKSRSQDLENTYHDAGMFYFLSTKQFMEHRTVFLEKNGGVELHPWFVQDIDNIEDWELAEIKFEMLAKKGSFLNEYSNTWIKWNAWIFIDELLQSNR